MIPKASHGSIDSGDVLMKLISQKKLYIVQKLKQVSGARFKGLFKNSVTAVTSRRHQAVEMHNLVGPGPNKAGFQEVEPGIVQIFNQTPVFVIPLDLKGAPGCIKGVGGQGINHS